MYKLINNDFTVMLGIQYCTVQVLFTIRHFCNIVASLNVYKNKYFSKHDYKIISTIVVHL